MNNNLSEEELLEQEEYKRKLFGEELYQKIKEAEEVFSKYNIKQ